MKKLFKCVLSGFCGILLLIAPLSLLIGAFKCDSGISERKVSPSNLAYISDNSLLSVSSPYYPQPQTYGSLVDEIIDCESGGNPEALGDEGRAKGILQFHEPTFQRYCVERYGYRNDIYDPEIQRECALEMLNENFDTNILNWSCYNLLVF